jgi:archaellum biogenesis ATPase FlaH
MESISLKNSENGFDGCVSTAGEIVIIKGGSTDEIMNYIQCSLPPETPFISISRTFPDRMREFFSGHNSQFYWLTNLVGENKIAPGSLGKIISMVKRISETGERFTLLIDGIEYLIAENDFITVLKFINQISDMVNSCGSALYLSVEPEAMNSRDLALVERTTGARSVSLHSDSSR